MMLPSARDALHRAWLVRLLTAILDEERLAPLMFFKGGTCASMLGYLDRFSVDLDFDLKSGADTRLMKTTLHRLFQHLGLEIKDESTRVLQFFLRYDAPAGNRNTMKLEIFDPTATANQYAPMFLADVDRYAVCQTLPTMVGNKLVAPLDRYERHRTIAGRDLYDIHYFLTHGYRYHPDVIIERRHHTLPAFFQELIAFIEQCVTDRVIQEDLSTLLPHAAFDRIRKTLKQEILVLLRDELKRVAARP